ncbi:ABC transporter permease subunit [Thermosipho ferrireducens]|uniref:ABC transporter permease subunit n=1 Tax=Thermosipho ferrireducens TaxID=2571116 RepID=A0ABX7S567_9BACT|nr:ABC transporter permease subunit [Thermosipho ferrireducens]QTA37274.1 ABC transporter permease subunit [Thermosipho ferrireducens]
MRKELLDLKVRSIVLLIAITGLFFVIAPLQKVTINMLSENAEAVEKFIGKGFVENLKDWKFYIYSQWFGKNFGQFIPIIAIIFAFPLFSREYESGTIEFLLTRNSRQRVFVNKLFVSSIILLAEIVFFSILPAIYSIIFSKELNYSYLFQFMIHVILGGMFWYSVTYMFSVVFNDQVKPILFSVVFLGGTTALGFLKPLQFLNTYTYILGTDILKGEGINVSYSFMLLLLTVIILIISYQVFLKKEI